jgi:flagellar biosynthetic protein FlhB
MADDDRTERPTTRRLTDAKKKGQLPRSKEVADAVQLAGVLLTLTWAGPRLVRGLMNATRQGLERMGDSPLRFVEPGELTGVAIQGIGVMALLVGPIAGAAVVCSVAGNVLQGGWNIATEAVRLDFSRLNPANGLRRLALPRAGLDLVRMLLVVTIICWLACKVVMAAVLQVPAMGLSSPANAAEVGWSEALRLLRYCATTLAIVALADLALARWRYYKSLRMTKQEVRDDVRLTDGNPEIKGRVRQKQREFLRRRMMASVPKATVVITNPTEYAVALQYHRDTMVAPVVLAKGRGAVAAKIRELARKFEVPIVENVPLAQALYRSVEIGDQIPSELFGAVAEVLAYLIRLKRLVM